MLQGKDGLAQQSQKPYLVPTPQTTSPPRKNKTKTNKKVQPVKKALHRPDSFNPTERYKDTSSPLYCQVTLGTEENSFLELPKADA